MKTDSRIISFSRCLATVLLLTLLVSPGYSQSSTGSVRGTVHDQSQAVVPNAVVTLTNTATNVASKSVTNEARLYEVRVRPPGLDTIQEFLVENNAPSAKFSRPTSIILTTKSGTNQFHGTLFETLRNNAFGKARAKTDLGVLPTLIRNEYGGTVGGPVWIPKIYNGRNRTFWFFSYEGFSSRSPASASGVVPTLEQRQGDFSQTGDSHGR